MEAIDFGFSNGLRLMTHKVGWGLAGHLAEAVKRGVRTKKVFKHRRIPPLRPSTRRHRKNRDFSQFLIDTGKMIKSISSGYEPAAQRFWVGVKGTGKEAKKSRIHEYGAVLLKRKKNKIGATLKEVGIRSRIRSYLKKTSYPGYFKHGSSEKRADYSYQLRQRKRYVKGLQGENDMTFVIPARSFIRPTINNELPYIKMKLNQNVREYFRRIGSKRANSKAKIESLIGFNPRSNIDIRPGGWA